MRKFASFKPRETSKIFEEQLMQIEHYRHFPQLKPFVGANYDQKKILLVGESHFLEDADPQTAPNWYSLCYDKLREADIRNTNTSKIIEDSTGKHAHIIYRNIHFAVCKSFGIDADAWGYLAFMNFFQRPSEKTSQSIDPTPQDKQIANDVFQSVVRILNPKKIVFVSKLAYSSCTDTTRARCVPHPGCAWWHRADKNGKKGKEMFIEILRQS